MSKLTHVICGCFKPGVVICLVLSLMGCSTQKKDSQVAENTEQVAENTEQVKLESHAPVIGPSKSDDLPVKLHIMSTPLSDGSGESLEVTVIPVGAVNGYSTLKIKPDPWTKTDVEEEIDLPELRNGEQAVRTVVLKGEHPGAEIRFQAVGDSFGFGVNETWPPQAVKLRTDIDIRQDLPAPIEVNGVMVDRGVEVGK